MLFVDNRDITDARVNLALEEYVFRNKPVEQDVLLFYVNAPSIIIGRNQNTIEEIAPDAVAEHDVRVVRRISGGGAVYHDLGNLNFSVMTPEISDRFNRYDFFTRPVIDVLRDLGVPAELSGRNDIIADGRKISGNAQFASHNRMFSHGTLLLDSNLDDVTAMLRPRPGKVESKGVKSVRSRVANISEFLAAPIDVVELRDLVIERIFGTRDRASVPSIELNDEDWAAVYELMARKYGTWDWNYGENPASNVQRSQRFPAGEIDVRIDVQKGHIAGLRIFGDFMGRADVSVLEKSLVGVPYERDAILEVLGDVDMSQYFGDIANHDVLALVSP
ncbi:MAG TPA: lipoate--protein ligase [Gemmatimonadales bacterium]|nr:lipoate--protein ligase [Gemmatimonadales bacterium]